MEALLLPFQVWLVLSILMLWRQRNIERRCDAENYRNAQRALREKELRLREFFGREEDIQSALEHAKKHISEEYGVKLY